MNPFLRQILWFYIFLTGTAIASWDGDGGVGGSGGGGIVCRDPITQRVLSAQFYDFFENRELGIRNSMVTRENSPSQEAKAIVGQWMDEFPSLYKLAMRELSILRSSVFKKITDEHERFRRDPQATSPKLPYIPDLGTDPVLPVSCLGFPKAIPAYENIFVYYDAQFNEDLILYPDPVLYRRPEESTTFQVDFNYEIYRLLPTIHQAGIRAHEAIYQLYRSFNKRKFQEGGSSLAVRPLIATLFSWVDKKELFKRTLEVFAPQDPFGEKIPGLKKWIWERSWQLDTQFAFNELDMIYGHSFKELVEAWSNQIFPLRDATLSGNGKAILQILKDAFFYRPTEYSKLDVNVNIPVRNTLCNPTANAGWKFKSESIPEPFRTVICSEPWLPLPVYAILASDYEPNSVTLILSQSTFDPGSASPSGLTALHAAALMNRDRYAQAILNHPTVRPRMLWNVPSPDAQSYDALSLAKKFRYQNVVNTIELALDPDRIDY